jgi:quercetin dioxygenase-like cupin family protein
MRARNLVAIAGSLLLAAVVLAQGTKAKTAPKDAASKLVVVPASDLKWADLDPKGAPGVMIADVWGDHTKGAFGAFIKLPPGFVAPLHTHTSDYKVVIVSGTYIQAPEGKPEFRLGPGSYFLQPGGNYKHTTSCDKASECVFFLQGSGRFDLKPVKAATAAAEPVPTAVPAPIPPTSTAPRQEASASGVADPGGQIAVSATRAGLMRIGAEKCKICHQVQFASWVEGSHARRKPPLDCESCHGPGSEYKSLAVMKDREKAKAAGMVIPTATFCARCHARGWKDDMLQKAHAHKTTRGSA